MREKKELQKMLAEGSVAERAVIPIALPARFYLYHHSTIAFVAPNRSLASASPACTPSGCAAAHHLQSF